MLLAAWWNCFTYCPATNCYLFGFYGIIFGIYWVFPKIFIWLLDCLQLFICQSISLFYLFSSWVSCLLARWPILLLLSVLQVLTIWWLLGRPAHHPLPVRFPQMQ